MDGSTLQGLIAKGMGTAARNIGSSYDLYRPRSVAVPMSAQNRVLTLDAAFRAEGGGMPRAPDYGKALWWGIFDATCTQPGDYLVGRNGTYFIAGQKEGLPVQCVLTNRVVTVVRPSAPSQGSYSGLFASPGERLILSWPASLLEAGGHSPDVRPGATILGNWEMLLPVLPIPLQVADVVTDDMGTTYVVGIAEQSTLGWRLVLRQLGA